ncbi:hypothetical protein [Nostoc sp.]|uniref:hypothetical protein n=1 Tax=Nostoc sp. TaxID=1180 RepID=UPI003FA5AB58
MWLDDFPEKRHHTIAVQAKIFEKTDIMFIRVLKNLVDGLSEVWVRVGQYWPVPYKSSITEARQKIGSEVISHRWLLGHWAVRSPLALAKPSLKFLLYD